MRYGLIGEKLGHSFSVEVHSLISDYSYELCEVSRKDFGVFMRQADFDGINVTIPYKVSVLPYLDEIAESAKKVGSVNTVVKRDGRLIGHNTDYFGILSLIRSGGIEIKGKKCAVLGTGGTSLAAVAALSELSAKEIYRVSRSKTEGVIDYGELYEKHSDTEVIINTTPVGMYPDNGACVIDLSLFKRLSLVVDVIYNPLKTSLVLNAERRGIKAVGGLFMLVSQAVRASEIFLDKSYPEDTAKKAYETLLKRKENIVLIGMPSSGKSTVGRLVAEQLSREFFDTDTLIEEKTGLTIPEIFEKHGEKYFRDIESEIIREISKKGGIVISTGGGAVLREENVLALKQNGVLCFLDRPLEKLIPTDTRPLSRDREAIEKRYAERYGIYKACADVYVNADALPSELSEIIIREI